MFLTFWLIRIIIVLLHSEIRKFTMKTIFKKYDKHAIPDLPRVVFPGEIKVVDRPEDVDAAVEYLLGQEILGVDTETRPSFKKGVSYEVCLLQVSTEDVCYLFRLNLVGMTSSVIKLLSDTTVPKIGLSWHDDLHQLHRRADFETGLFVEIQEIAKEFGIADMSLQKLYANLFHQKISKAQRLSNWECAELRDSQKVYAATDAWACIQLYREFLRLKTTGDYVLEVPIEPEPLEMPSDTELADEQKENLAE